jgi:hypothetical protein
MVNDVTTDLQTLDETTIMGRRCPTFVKTRDVYLVDVLGHILYYRGTANKVRGVLEHDPMQESLTRLYWIFLAEKFSLWPLSVDSASFIKYYFLQSKSCGNLIRFVCRLAPPEAAIVDSVTAHFAAGMKANAFDSIITAWVLSGHRRQTVRVDEAHFMTWMNFPAGETLLDGSCVEVMRF